MSLENIKAYLTLEPDFSPEQELFTKVVLIDKVINTFIIRITYLHSA
jgi:hypothetical protein